MPREWHLTVCPVCGLQVTNDKYGTDWPCGHNEEVEEAEEVVVVPKHTVSRDPSKLELFGVYEISQSLGVTPSLVHRWIREGRLPEPVAELRMGKVWDARVIRDWQRTRVADRRRRGVI